MNTFKQTIAEKHAASIIYVVNLLKVIYIEGSYCIPELSMAEV